MRVLFFFFQAEDGIRDLVRSRGLGDVYKRQGRTTAGRGVHWVRPDERATGIRTLPFDGRSDNGVCLLYTSDAADDLLCVDLGGRRIIKKKKHYEKKQGGQRG